MVQAHTGGIAARSEDYMRRHWDHAKGLADDAALGAARQQEERAFVALQRDAGLPLLAPALVAWEDLFRPFVHAWSGVAPGALTRYFETNTFFRQPHVAGEIGAQATGDDFFAPFAPPAATPWVLTLPSPWDFAQRSQDDHYGDGEALALAYAARLAEVADAGAKRGAAVIRFHDPAAVYPRAPPPPPDLYRRLLATAAGDHRDRAVLHLTNGDPFERVEVLNANPLPGLSIEDPGRKAPPGLALPAGTRLTAAVIRGEESLVEDPAVAATAATQLAAATGATLWGVTNGWDLDHVPHSIQARKIQALAKVAQILAPANTKEAIA